MSLRRGFKARANQISVRLRKGQGRSPQAPIYLEIIADRLGIEIVPLSVLKGDCQTAVRRLSIIDNGSFSAATLPIHSGQHIIVHNDSHDPRRQRGNLTHELAYLLLGHPGEQLTKRARLPTSSFAWLSRALLYHPTLPWHVSCPQTKGLSRVQTVPQSETKQ